VTGGAEGGVDERVYRTFFQNRPSGICLDVGAAGPEYLSIGNGFRKHGWRVISVEANPIFAQMHRERGHEVIEAAAGKEDRDDVDFTIFDFHGAPYEGGSVTFESFSSLGTKPEYAASIAVQPVKPDIRTIKVKVRRLDTILRDLLADGERIDVLSIDIEGWELEALSALDFERYLPRVVIVENNYDTPLYTEFMSKRGYALWRILPPNYVYLSRGTLASASYWQRAMHRFRDRWVHPFHKPNRPPSVSVSGDRES
jgi:FkbM family methyltransferase